MKSLIGRRIWWIENLRAVCTQRSCSNFSQLNTPGAPLGTAGPVRDLTRGSSNWDGSLGLTAGFPTSLSSRMASIPLGDSVINKPTAPPSPQPGRALLALLPSPAPGVRPSRHAGPQSAACPFATRFAGPPRRPTSLFPPPPSLPLQLLIVFHRGGAAPGKSSGGAGEKEALPHVVKGAGQGRKEETTDGRSG